MKTGNWKKELARDFIALGSWVFYILVIGRILILPYRWPFLYHILIAGALILILNIFVKKTPIDYYVSRATVLGFFTSLFYKNNIYNGFVIIIFLGLLLSSWYIGDDLKKTGFGFLLGLVSIGFGFLIGGWLT